MGANGRNDVSDLDDESNDLGMSFGGFDDTTPGWGVHTSTAGDIVTNAIKKEKLIKYVTFGGWM